MENSVMVPQILKIKLLCCVHVLSHARVCKPMDCSPLVSSVHGNFQARVLGRVLISFSRGSSGPRDWNHVSCIPCISRWVLYKLTHQGSLKITTKKCSYNVSHSGVSNSENPWMVARQASLSMKFSRQEYWSR